MGIWTDKKIEKLIQLWEKGMPTAEIGKKLDFSKNAIVGKVHRLGLSNRVSPIKNSSSSKKASVKTKEEKVVLEEKKVSKKTTKTSKKPEVIEEKVVSVPEKNESQNKKEKVSHTGVKLLDLTSGHCCWPVDDAADGEFHFCGKEVYKNKPYCLEHCVLAYSENNNASNISEDIDGNIDIPDNTDYEE